MGISHERPKRSIERGGNTGWKPGAQGTNNRLEADTTIGRRKRAVTGADEFGDGRVSAIYGRCGARTLRAADSGLVDRAAARFDAWAAAGSDLLAGGQTQTGRVVGRHLLRLIRVERVGGVGRN